MEVEVVVSERKGRRERKGRKKKNRKMKTKREKQSSYLARGLVVREVGLVEGLLLDDLFESEGEEERRRRLKKEEERGR